MGHDAKWEYFRVMYERYSKAKGTERSRLLDEFCISAGYNRKYAIRLLNGVAPERQRVKRPRGRKPRYGKQVISILLTVWEVAGYPWSVRLKALLPNWMPWIRQRYRPSAEVEKQLLAMRARQMDRRLQARKREQKRKTYGGTKPGALLKHHIPVKTDGWDVKTPGFTEVDLVAHSGDSANGEFAHSLNVTDIHTGWTESAALLGKSEVAVQAALEEIRAGLPFRLLGVDSDNGSEFINWHLKRWCDREQIQLSRGRPYKKDDNAHIEQKNWTHVRQLLGWERYDSRAAVEAINAVYRQELRLWMNLYQPSVKLVKKVRVGSKLRRVYSPAQTPFERVLASGQGDSRRVAELKKLRSLLDPFELSRSIDRKLESIYALANGRLSPKATTLRGATAAAGNGYIFNVSTAAAPVTFLNGLTRRIALGEVKRGELSVYDGDSKTFHSFLSGLSGAHTDFSRDGQWVTYVSYPLASLWRSLTDGSERLQLTSPDMGEVLNPRWSPDGRFIAFMMLTGGAKIYLIPAEGGSPMLLLSDDSQPMDPTWFPDGKSILYGGVALIRGRNSEIHIFDLETKTSKAIPGSTGLFSPRLSPDGRRVAALSQDQSKLYVYGFESRSWRQIYSAPQKGMRLGWPAWSRDSNWVYVGTISEIYRIRMADGRVETAVSVAGVEITEPIWGQSWFGITPDDRILVMRDRGSDELYALDLEYR